MIAALVDNGSCALEKSSIDNRGEYTIRSNPSVGMIDNTALFQLVGNTIEDVIDEKQDVAEKDSKFGLQSRQNGENGIVRSGLKPEHLPVFDCAFKPHRGKRNEPVYLRRTLEVLATLGFRYTFDGVKPALGVAAMISALPVLIPIVIILLRRIQTREVQL